MKEAHGVKCPPAQRAFQFSGMPFNFRIRAGCLIESASESFVRLILFIYRLHDPFEFTIELSEHLMYLNALGQPILVINSLKTAFELLDRRASIYSDRPPLIVGNGILAGGLLTGLMPYGDVLVCPFIPKVGAYYSS